MEVVSEKKMCVNGDIFMCTKLPCLFYFKYKDLATGSVDRTVKYVDSSGGVVWDSGLVHEAAVNKIQIVDPTLVLSGDDDGCIKMWDVRVSGKAVMEMNHHEVSNMINRRSAGAESRRGEEQ